MFLLPPSSTSIKFSTSCKVMAIGAITKVDTTNRNNFTFHIFQMLIFGMHRGTMLIYMYYYQVSGYSPFLFCSSLLTVEATVFDSTWVGGNIYNHCFNETPNRCSTWRVFAGSWILGICRSETERECKSGAKAHTKEPLTTTVSQLLPG